MKSKILIINPPFLAAWWPPLGCAYIKSALKNAGYLVDIADLNALFLKKVKEEDESFWDNVDSTTLDDTHQKIKLNQLLKYNHLIDKEIDKIIKNNYQYILFSIYCTQKYPALEIARRIKEKNKNIQIIFGGTECFKHFCLTGNYKDLIRDHSFVDYQIYVSEGEKIIVELINEIENNKPARDATQSVAGGEIKSSGVIKREGGQIIENPQPELIKDIDSIPFPDWEGFDLSLYSQKHALPIISSRGCINKCVFCNEHKMFKYLRVRTAKNVFAEIKQDYEKFGATLFLFTDSSINSNLKELEKLCDLIINSDMNIRFSGQINFRNCLDKNLLKKMYGAGCRLLLVGLESGSQKVVDLMGKHLDIKKSEVMIKNAKKIGIKTCLNFMFGFPGETEEDFQETLDYLKRNKDYIGEIAPKDLFTVIVKNTDLANNLEKFSIKPPLNNLAMNFFWETKDGTNNFLVRLNRFEKLCKTAKKLKIENLYGNTQHNNRESIIQVYHETMARENKKTPTLTILPRFQKMFGIKK